VTGSNEEHVATTQEALQISTIVPMFTVDDLQKSITFYEALGFAVDERWEDSGKLLGRLSGSECYRRSSTVISLHGIQHTASAT
jgi:catechol 2,3-dioxygenase-like lactoylglutathione lyase family enzyme